MLFVIYSGQNFNPITFTVDYFSGRDKIRTGLEELQRVLPGGDTFMHEGIQRVSRW